MLTSAKNIIRNNASRFIFQINGLLSYLKYYFRLNTKLALKINICSGDSLLPEYCNIDIHKKADLVFDVGKRKMPFQKNSVETAICISAINYFSKETGQKIINETYRVLKHDGVARFATQDLELISKKYCAKDYGFFYQKLPNGKQRFKGETICDMMNAWFYGGYPTANENFVKYFYDFETLALMFKKAGFKQITRKEYMESDIQNIEQIDNRPDQMFFLEAIK